MNALGFIIGLLGFLSAGAATWVTREAHKSAKEAALGKERLDTLSLGQSSLAAALARSDVEIERLNGRVERAEAGEARCWERVSTLTSQVEDLMRRV